MSPDHILGPICTVAISRVTNRAQSFGPIRSAKSCSLRHQESLRLQSGTTLDQKREKLVRQPELQHEAQAVGEQREYDLVLRQTPAILHDCRLGIAKGTIHRIVPE